MTNVSYRSAKLLIIETVTLAFSQPYETVLHVCENFFFNIFIGVYLLYNGVLVSPQMSLKLY